MSLYTVDHPVAREVATILNAAEQGLEKSDLLPSHIKLDFDDPFESKTGAAVLRIADWHTENLTSIQLPVFCGSESEMTLTYTDGTRLTEARILVSDCLARPFPIVGPMDTALTSRHIQFDIADQGLAFSTYPNGEQVSMYGIYESERYASYARMARRQASIQELYDISVRFLETAA